MTSNKQERRNVFEDMEKYYDILNHLLYHSENEVVEFKAAKNSFDVDDLGKYFSALSNEANLREHDFAWIVFGVDKFIQNAGNDGTKREFVIKYLQEALPARNTKEQNQRLVGNILIEMSSEGSIVQKDKIWYATTSKSHSND